MATVFLAKYQNKPIGIYSTAQKAREDIEKAFQNTFFRRKQKIKKGHYLQWRTFIDKQTNLFHAYADEFINNQEFCFGVNLGTIEEVIIDKFQPAWEYV